MKKPLFFSNPNFLQFMSKPLFTPRKNRLPKHLIDDQTVSTLTLPLSLIARIIADYVPMKKIYDANLFSLCSRTFTSKLIRRLLIAQPLTVTQRTRFWLDTCGKIKDLVTYERFAIGDPKIVSRDDIFYHHANASRSEDAIGEIDRDVVRTMPHHPLFSPTSELGELNRSKLQKILLAVSNAHLDVGYCQGMNFVAATLLINLNMDEINAFWMFLAIIRNYHFKDLYSPAVPLLPLRMYHFSRIIRSHIPNVWHHLNSKTFSVEVFANQWIMTMFAYYLEPEILGTVWDLFFHLGWKYIFKLGGTILKILEPRILDMDVEEISGFMSSVRGGGANKRGSEHPFSSTLAPSVLKDQLFRSLDEFKITNSHLEMYSKQFFNSKLMSVVNELPTEIFDNKRALFALNKVPIGATIIEEESRTPGFIWLKIKRDGIDHTEPMFLYIDLSTLTTPNRPREILQFKARRVQLPLKSIQEIKISVNYISEMYTKEIQRVANELANFEKLLMIEMKQINALAAIIAKADELLKDVASRKYLMSKNLKDAVSRSPSSRSGTPVDSGTVTPKITNVSPSAPMVNDVSGLLAAVGEIESEYAEKKRDRNKLVDEERLIEGKVREIESRKRTRILEMTKIISTSEEVQNEIISRSIHSAIDSFSSP